jgi:hypothetical protein
MDEVTRLLSDKIPEVVAGIIQKEQEVFRLHEAVLVERRLIQVQEDEALLRGMVEGKNAELREAQLRQFSAQARGRLWEAERIFGYAKIELEGLRLEFKALCALARLLAPEDE